MLPSTNDHTYLPGVSPDSLEEKLTRFAKTLENGGSLTYLDGRLVEVEASPIEAPSEAPSLVSKIKGLVQLSFTSFFASSPPHLPVYEVVEGIKALLLTAEAAGLSGSCREQLETIKEFRDAFINSNPNIRDLDKQIPRDVVRLIAQNLEIGDVVALSSTSKAMWAKTKDIFDFPEIKKIMFGPSKWSEICGLEVKHHPKVPQNILDRVEVLIAEGRLDACKLILMPAGLSLSGLEDLQRRNGSKGEFGFVDSEVKQKYWNEKVKESYWVLMHTELLDREGVRNSDLISHVQSIGEGYDAPTLLEAVVLCFEKGREMDGLVFGGFDYTVCKELLAPSHGNPHADTYPAVKGSPNNRHDSNMTVSISNYSTKRIRVGVVPVLR